MKKKKTIDGNLLVKRFVLTCAVVVLGCFIPYKTRQIHIDHLDKEITSYEEENKQLSEKLRGLKVENASLKSENKTLKSENKNLASEVEALENQLTNKEADVSLDSCPVCYKDGVAIYTYMDAYYAQCRNCGIRSDYYQNKKNLEADWNKLCEVEE